VLLQQKYNGYNKDFFSFLLIMSGRRNILIRNTNNGAVWSKNSGSGSVNLNDNSGSGSHELSTSYPLISERQIFYFTL